MTDPVELRLLTKEEVLDRVKLSFTSVWKKMQAGTFPRGLVQGSGEHERNRVFWYEHEIQKYLAGLQQKRIKGDA
jgi:predicted DNA-binding transcriptional regulator AlpA